MLVKFIKLDMYNKIMKKVVLALCVILFFLLIFVIFKSVNYGSPLEQKNGKKEFLSGDTCEIKLEKINKWIDEKNYCETVDDCQVDESHFGCPVGCYQLINKGEGLEDVQVAYNAYVESCGACLFDCGRTPVKDEVRCVKNKCVDKRYMDEQEKEGSFCGGIANIPCPKGFSCQLEGSYPDAGGKCVPYIKLID